MGKRPELGGGGFADVVKTLIRFFGVYIIVFLSVSPSGDIAKARPIDESLETAKPPAEGMRTYVVS